MGRGLPLTALGLAMFVAAHFAGEKITATRSVGEDPYELMYLPEGKVLEIASLGYRNFLADLIWLRTIQYYGEHRLTDRNYDQAERLFTAIYELDPAFKGATRFGALVLAQDAANPEAAIALLQRAERDNPGVWEYVFDQGFIQQTVTRDLAAAGESFRRASQIPGAPDLVARMAGTSFARLGDRDAAREIWSAILEEGDNKMMKRLAERNLMTLDMETAEDLLTEAVAEFRNQTGRFPEGWNELSRTRVDWSTPNEPFGGRFFLDPKTGRVWASTHIDRRMAIQRDIVARIASDVQADEGTYPGSIREMFERELIDAMPWEPFGVRLEYDAASGRVAWNPPWDPTEPRNHGESSG